MKPAKITNQTKLVYKITSLNKVQSLHQIKSFFNRDKCCSVCLNRITECLNFAQCSFVDCTVNLDIFNVERVYHQRVLVKDCKIGKLPHFDGSHVIGIRSFRPMVLSPEDVSPDLRVDLPEEKVDSPGPRVDSPGLRVVSPGLIKYWLIKYILIVIGNKHL